MTWPERGITTIVNHARRPESVLWDPDRNFARLDDRIQELLRLKITLAGVYVAELVCELHAVAGEMIVETTCVVEAK